MMASKEVFTFTTSDGVKLVCARYEPSRPSKGTIGFFSPGWSADFNDYEPLTKRLVDDLHYNLIAVNPRGHAGSGGILHPTRSIDDLEEIFNKHGEERAAFLGHSISSFAIEAARRTDPKAIILINPYINTSYLTSALKTGVHVSHAMKKTGISWLLDGPLSLLPLHKVGLHMKYPIANTATLKDIDLKKFQPIDTPLLYFVADQDRTLGTKKRSKEYQEFIGTMSTDSQDASDLVTGLNHCLNYEGLVPFFKEEQGKDRDRVFEKVESFLSSYMR